MARLTVQDLSTPRLDQLEVDIPGQGTVLVRALSRSQALSVKDKELDAGELDRRLLAMALVDPPMTKAEVRAWQEASPAGELEVVVAAVVKLSGMEVASAKQAGDDFRE